MQKTLIDSDAVSPSPEAMEQLASVFAAYNETADRMRRSYQQLQAEVVRLRREVEHKNEQLERKSRLAALGEMAAGMAHEIRNPLGGVQLYASLLERDLQGQDEPLGWVRKISNGVRNLDLIVNDILAFTQDQVCEKTQVNLFGLLMEVLDYLRPQIEANRAEVDCAQVDRQLMIHADINMMHRVFLNLILNAIESGEQGAMIRLSAEHCVDSPGHDVRICVRDNGPGFKLEVMGKIFNPFFTTKDTGTGLGLAIVHRLVECHGGAISASNNEAGGAIFMILLP